MSDQPQMILHVHVDGAEAFVSVRNVPADMRDSEVKLACQHAADQGCTRAARALQLVDVWCDLSGGHWSRTTRVYRDGGL